MKKTIEKEATKPVVTSHFDENGPTLQEILEEILFLEISKLKKKN